jgi:hypothetical protein
MGGELAAPCQTKGACHQRVIGSGKTGVRVIFHV